MTPAVPATHGDSIKITHSRSHVLSLILSNRRDLKESSMDRHC